MKQNTRSGIIRGPSIQDYMTLIKRALSEIDHAYFSIATTYRLKGITRERAFCYELYHRIRTNMTRRHQLTLHAEIDKRGHEDFALEDRLNPDFVFHSPGTHYRNALVIEVKGKIRNNCAAIQKDFNTLLTFTNKYNYQAGVFILFGHSFADLKRVMGSEFATLKNQPGANHIYILCAQYPNQDCEEYLLSDV